MKKCRLCRNTELLIVSKKVRDSKKHKIIKCTKCKFVQLNPVPGKKEISEFYNKNKQLQEN